MAKKNSSVLWTVQQSLEKTDKELARKNIGFDTFQTPKSESGNALKFVTDIVEESNGDLKYNTKNVDVLETYDSTSGKPASGKSIKAAIDTLTSSSTLTGGNYYTGMTETAGIVTLTQAAMDTSPTKNSTKPVTSGGVYTVTKSLSDSIDSINTAISNMDYTDSAVANQFVTSVSEANGVISVTRAQPTAAGISGLKAFSTVSDGTNSFEAAAYNSTLKFVSGTAIDPVVDATNKEVKFNHKNYHDSDGGTILPSTVSLSGYDIKLPWASYNKQGHITASGQYIFNVTHPGAGVLQFKFGSASAVSTGFNANSGSNVTYTFPNAANSDYGVTKLYKYGSSAPSDWSSFSTLDDTAVTPKSVAQYFSGNDDKRMVGTGNSATTYDPADPHTMYIPFTESDAASYKRSYTGLTINGSTKNLLRIDWNATDGFSAKLFGENLALFTNADSHVDGQLMVASDAMTAHIDALSSTIGDSCDTDVGVGNYKPVFVKNGKITELPRLWADFQTSPTNLQGITLRYDSTNNAYCIGTHSYQTAYTYHPGTPATEDDAAVPSTFDLLAMRGVLFGDGLGIGTTQAKYWDVPGGDLVRDGKSPIIVEAPSVTYAYPYATSAYGESMPTYEVWNPHRVLDYDDCNKMRHGSPGSTSNYIAKSTFNYLAPTQVISMLPAHHWGFYTLNLDSSIYSGAQRIYCYVHLYDSDNLSVIPTGVTSTWDSNCLAAPSFDSNARSSFSFMAYNNSNEPKYIWLGTTGLVNTGSLPDKIDVYPQVFIFKTPELRDYKSVDPNSTKKTENAFNWPPVT